MFPTAFGFVFGFVVIETLSQNTFHFLIHTVRGFIIFFIIMIWKNMYLIDRKGDRQWPV